jgi:hypothetical protein
MALGQYAAQSIGVIQTAPSGITLAILRHGRAFAALG